MPRFLVATSICVAIAIAVLILLTPGEESPGGLPEEPGARSVLLGETRVASRKEARTDWEFRAGTVERLEGETVMTVREIREWVWFRPDSTVLFSLTARGAEVDPDQSEVELEGPLELRIWLRSED